MLERVRAAKHIVVRKDRNRERSPGGIYLPQTMVQNVQWGEVVCAPENSSVKKGDWVIFSRYNVSPFIHQDEEYVALQENKLFAVIEDVD